MKIYRVNLENAVGVNYSISAEFGEDPVEACAKFYDTELARTGRGVPFLFSEGNGDVTVRDFYTGEVLEGFEGFVSSSDRRALFFTREEDGERAFYCVHVFQRQQS